MLICAVGMSPAVVTETVWYLCVEKGVPLSEVWVLTTGEGKRGLERALFEGGVWDRFRQEYGDCGAGEIDFNRRRIVVFKDRRGLELQDIRTPEENGDAAERIVEFVREKTADPNTALHCSVAGGRKTMGVYLAYALQLFGREQDTLSHVLVHPPEMEACRDFFYPPKVRRVFQTHNGRRISSNRVRVEAAEIPFVRLRHILDPSWLTLGYPALVARTQRQLDEGQIRVCLDLEKGQVEFHVCDDEPVIVRLGVKRGAAPHLPGLQAAYYTGFLLKTRDPEADTLLPMVRRLYRHLYRAGHRAQSIDRINPSLKSQMNNVVEEALRQRGYAAFAKYVRVADGAETLLLPPDQIEVRGEVPDA
ncbi:MAG: CRISPR-associated protein [Candidatus Handelsmanbacteria bacterium RIFCSPLOWO2_12_FULL_64_10]|uniref:CRISPR-associated protein n=1 Tax=Handelsmanbacteria sp. (strain RIFCSPLOWO2_12_FULL_64_10) TaxID=1817868 RepID=A0A1F6CQ87_HANXR|nr:MAG: CRISPR-associated protein [Candidatus Handelsmanbacteria bacterium RIFCSPLOWO2_12_FULL_64_10]